MKNELIEIEKGTEIKTLTVGINDLVQLVNDKYGSNVFDMNTAKGRKEIVSNAFKVTKSKTFIAKAIDEAISRKEEEIKPVLETIKALKESKKLSNKHLTELSTDLRQSVTEFENELEAKKLQEEIDGLYDEAVQMNIAFDKEVENKRLIELAIKTEHENKIKAEAAAKAKLLAEQNAAKAIEDAKKAVVEAEKKAKLAEVKRLYDIDQAKKAEIAKQKAKEQAILDAQAKRDADINHKKTINNKVLSELTALGLDDEQAKAVIKAIVVGKVSNVTIKY